MREKLYLNNDWKYKNTFNEDMLESSYNYSSFESVRLPHSVVVTPYNYFDEGIYQMVSCYQRSINVPLEWQDKNVLLVLEGVAHYSEVYLNGKLLSKHHCGYPANKVDFSEHLLYGTQNNLVVRADSNETINQPPFGNVIDYMTYGGMYREAYIEVKEKYHIKDVFPKVSLENDVVILESEVLCSKLDKHSLKQELYDLDNNLIRSFEIDLLKHTVEGVKLWDIDNPHLYYLKTILLDGDNKLDERVDRIGFRTCEFREDGFYLNNKKIKLRGLNRHQSYPYVGYAMPKNMQVSDAKILKEELGLNAVRTSHYPQSHHFINACDELGLLVFTEIPGWQHIGNEEWKEYAVKNTKDMVLEYRNHPSIILWGVRINESMDDDNLYLETNKVAHELDSTRQTSGVRFIQKSSLLEDVYAYNDFSHTGNNPGTLSKKNVTPNTKKGYLVSEYNGHMFPTKAFDQEDHRVDHMLRHANVIDSYYKYDDIAGGFGWCMADYNTHKDFGSGDRICYHGVLDMYRNHKLAASVYSSQSDTKDVLEISSTMDIGEHPASVIKEIYAVTNADSINLYKNDKFVKNFTREKSVHKNMPFAPILIDDIIGSLMEEGEGFHHKKAEEVKKILLAANKYGMNNLPFNIKLLAAKCMLFRGLKISDAVSLYGKYISNWGSNVTEYRFDAIKDGKVVNTVMRRPVKKVNFDVTVSHTELIESVTYDVASIRVKVVSQDKTLLPFYQDALKIVTTGPIEIIGPEIINLRGGMGGTYIKTTGEEGVAKVYLMRENDLVFIQEFIVKVK